MRQPQRRLEFTQYISPDGEIFDFHDMADTFLFTHAGFGMPPITYIRSRGPFQHGSTVIDYRLEPRQVQLVFREKGCDLFDYWSNRMSLLDIMRPNRQVSGTFGPGKLRMFVAGNKKYDLDVFLAQGLQFTRRDGENQDDFSISESLIFTADDPTLYNPTVECYSWTFASINSLVFPFAIPFTFGSSSTLSDVTVNYVGTWPSFPNIVIIGPISTPILTNTATGEFIRLDYTVAVGEAVTMTLNYSYKTVVSSSRGNIIGYISDDSSLATFHIAPSPEVSGGVNVFTLSGLGVSAGTSVSLSFYTRYIGI